MLDRDAPWRAHPWTFDCEYVERAEAPVLAGLIDRYGCMVDDTWTYIFQGKAKQYILRFKHYDGKRWNPRIDMKKKDTRGKQLKLPEFTRKK